MPQIASASKRMRSDAKKRLRNTAGASAILTIKKSFRQALQTDKTQAQKIGLDLISRVDKAASKGIIPKGRADRVKSRVHAELHRLGCAASSK
ncbi:MAG: 30S ribosomal protein S20 [Candidatus Omnitrophica bacterium]|nr:30S ribosomal protein S20 [Candidatus Omnitrophota bacterium]